MKQKQVVQPDDGIAKLDWAALARLSPVVLMFARWKQKQQFELEVDTYPCWGLFAIESGSFRYGIGTHTGVAHAGDLVLFPPNVAFHREVIQPLCFHFWKFTWKEETTGAAAELPQLPVCKITLANQQRLRDNWQLCRTPPTTNGTASPSPWVSHALNDIWKDCCYQFTLAAQAIAPAYDPLMEQARAYLLEHFREALTIKLVAHELGLSSVQFIRRFRAAYGQTPMEYVTEMRLEQACTYIRDTSWTVDQIAQHCGYATGFYLSRLMKRKLGVTPSQYRNLFRI